MKRLVKTGPGTIQVVDPNKTWVTKCGQIIDIVDLEDEHLLNILNYAIRRSHVWRKKYKVNALLKEAKKRKLPDLIIYAL